MQKYWCAHEGQPAGPFTIDELKDKNLTKETLIWYEGLASWQKADSLPELAELFTKIAVPPPLGFFPTTH